MTDIGPITYYLHDDYDDEERKEWVNDLIVDRPEFAPHRDQIAEFFENRPFYEIGLDIYINSDTGEARVGRVFSTSGRSFTQLQEVR